MNGLGVVNFKFLAFEQEAMSCDLWKSDEISALVSTISIVYAKSGGFIYIIYIYI